MTVADQKKTRAPGGEAHLFSNQPSALDGLKTLLSDGQQSPFRVNEDHIHSLLLARRARDALLGRDLFSDPAWDMLLELYAAKLAGRTMTLEQLALATETPPSTAARWLSALDERGLITSVGHSNDDFGTVVLSAEGLSKLERLAHRWGSAFVAI
jgi:DNA-binding MarR family transcriptional regulator